MKCKSHSGFFEEQAKVLFNKAKCGDCISLFFLGGGGGGLVMILSSKTALTGLEQTLKQLYTVSKVVGLSVYYKYATVVISHCQFDLCGLQDRIS